MHKFNFKKIENKELYIFEKIYYKFINGGHQGKSLGGQIELKVRGGSTFLVLKSW